MHSLTCTKCNSIWFPTSPGQFSSPACWEPDRSLFSYRHCFRLILSVSTAVRLLTQECGQHSGTLFNKAEQHVRDGKCRLLRVCFSDIHAMWSASILVLRDPLLGLKGTVWDYCLATKLPHPVFCLLVHACFLLYGDTFVRRKMAPTWNGVQQSMWIILISGKRHGHLLQLLATSLFDLESRQTSLLSISETLRNSHKNNVDSALQQIFSYKTLHILHIKVCF